MNILKHRGATQFTQEERPHWKTPFFTIWIGQAVSLLGSQLVQFALIWYLTRETGSAVVLTTATLVAMLPQIVLGPIVGSLVDRGNRRRFMIAADSTIALLTVGLALLFATGWIRIWHIYAIMFLRSLAGSFQFINVAQGVIFPRPGSLPDAVWWSVDVVRSAGRPAAGNLAHAGHFGD